MRYILFILILTGCNHEIQKDPEAGEYAWHIVHIALGPDRYENNEAICYQMYDGLQCKFKEPPK